MERIIRNSQIIILGVCIAAATIIASVIISGGIMKVMKFTREQIKVTGSATKAIRSDYIVWQAEFTRREPDLKQAYADLREDLATVMSYLDSRNIKTADITVSPVSTETIYRKNEKGHDTNDIEGYRLLQRVEIRSHDVDTVDAVARRSTELINKGIRFSSFAPEYFYTKLDELKIEMLAKATENAKQRAISMTQATGNKIGAMRAAKMGVFQITPLNSTEVSSWGINDTSALDKKVMAVVSASFAIE